MELQQRTFSCGPAALRSVLYVLGRNVQEATLRKWANTTPGGTNEHGIIRALHHYDFKTKEVNESSKKRAWQLLRGNLQKGKPVLLCVDSWDHWISVVGCIGNKVLAFDPERIPGKRRRYSGLRTYTEQELADRWAYTEDGAAQYYAIVVYK